MGTSPVPHLQGRRKSHSFVQYCLHIFTSTKSGVWLVLGERLIIPIAWSAVNAVSYIMRYIVSHMLKVLFQVLTFLTLCSHSQYAVGCRHIFTPLMSYHLSL